MDNTLNILANAGDAVCAVNNNKRVVYWNPAAEKLLGISAEKADGQPCWKLLKGKTLEGEPFCSPDCPIHAKIDTAEPIPHFDLWIKNNNGRSILANLSTIIVPKQNGHRQPDQAAIIHLIRAVNSAETPQHRLRVSILGPLQVWRPDGSEVGGKFWQRTKVRSLFVFLALKKGTPATREELLERFWPDVSRQVALRSLNTAVYHLRRSLEPDLKQGNESQYIHYDSGYYWLGGSQPHEIDINAFELGIKQARIETAVAKAIQLYEETTALYRGDYLVDLPTTDPTLFSEQARLRQLYLSALEELGSLYLQQERPEEARKTYLRILAVDPYRESTSHLLVQLSYKTGTRTDNIAYCQRLAAALKSELDLILSQDLNERHNPKA